MRVLVTQASSELGLAIGAALVELGVEVVAFDEGSLQGSTAEVGPDLGAIHLARPASGLGIEWHERRAAIETDVLGTMRLLEAFGRADVAHLVLASTADEVGSFASAIALAREDHARAFGEEAGAGVCVVRLAGEAREGGGPTQRAARAIAHAARRGLVGAYTVDALLDATGDPSQ